MFDFSLDLDSAIELHSLLPPSGDLGNHVGDSENDDGNFLFHCQHPAVGLTLIMHTHNTITL